MTTTGPDPQQRPRDAQAQASSTGAKQPASSLVSAAIAAHLSGLPSRERLQQDALLVLVALANQARFVFLRDDLRGHDALWSLLSPDKPTLNFADPDAGPAGLGLTFEDVADLGLAKALMRMYDFGVLGQKDTSQESLDSDEGDAAWIARILHDLARSEFLAEWAEYTSGENLHEATKRCLDVAELANARVLLEGGDEGFFLGDREAGFLTFRQLSLLSGMSEATLRTLASRAARTQGDGPHVVGALRTVRHGKDASIEVADAKEWLKARGRYLPIRHVSDRGALGFETLRFSEVQELQMAVDARIDYLCAELGKEVVAGRLRATQVSWSARRIADGQTLLSVPDHQWTDPARMERLGAALDWPPQLFALRAAQTWHTEQLRRVEQALKNAKPG